MCEPPNYGVCAEEFHCALRLSQSEALQVSLEYQLEAVVFLMTGRSINHNN